MNPNVLLPEPSVEQFAQEQGIDLASDIGRNNWTARLAKVGENGKTTQHIENKGANYLFSQIDYCEADEIKASRMVAIIPPGNRTELAYWTEDAPVTIIDIHRGDGLFLKSKPGNSNVVEVEKVVISSNGKREILLPEGCFYTFIASRNTEQPLVVSGLYRTEVDWSKFEVVLNAGQVSLDLPEGIITVPEEFIKLQEQQRET